MKALLIFLAQHSIEVTGHTEDSISVVAQYSRDGVAFSVPEIIPATWEGVRNWLGY
ncbi:MAG: hypothetical protein V4621_07715 [Pseudomonadota bacterium]